MKYEKDIETSFIIIFTISVKTTKREKKSI
jgi:hypothetical protein